MNAYEVAKPLSGSGVVDGFAFSFGIDPPKVAAQLRRLADAIEGNVEAIVLADENRVPSVFVERVTHETTAYREDFTTSKITMIIAERIRTS